MGYTDHAMPPMPLRAVIAALLIALPGGLARADGPVRQFLEFNAAPSAPELRAVRKHARPLLAKAEKAGRPADPRVARSGGTVLISLESVALCDRVSGCPLLVFRNLDNSPVLSTMSFQNAALEYREAGTYLLPRTNAGAPTECLISGTGKASCKPIKTKGQAR